MTIPSVRAAAGRTTVHSFNPIPGSRRRAGAGLRDGPTRRLRRHPEFRLFLPVHPTTNRRLPPVRRCMGGGRGWATQTYPATRHEVSPLIDLSDRTERERLGSAAVRAFFNIMARWKIRDDDARRLLGGMSNGTYYALKKNGKGRVLNEDRICRISYLVGIFKALNILYDEELADRWMQLPNKNSIFGGTPPHEYLMQGGLPAFATVRKLLDARRGGR